MTDKDDDGKARGPGGLTFRELHAQVKKSAQRDRERASPANKLAHAPSRWQRFVRYVWDKNRGRG